MDETKMREGLWDKILLGIAVGCILLPIIIFLYGWTKLYIAVIGTALLIYLGVRIWKSIDYNSEISITKNKGFWAVALGAIAVWVMFSGIGNFSFQTGDFIVRNPMFRDLYLYRWPVYYHLNDEPEFVQQVIYAKYGYATSATYVYYFAWWLPAAALAKIANGSEAVGNIALYLWAVLELFLAFYCIVRYISKYSYWILSAFMMFGGMDFIMWVICNMSLPVNDHIEWWTSYFFQYSANTTQVYWVFNQSIPVWLIIGVLLLLTRSRSSIALSSLSFAYSPFATIGFVPIAIASVFNADSEKGDTWGRIRRAISLENILVPLLMLVIFGSFYMQNNNSLTGNNGIIFQIYPYAQVLPIYVIFVLSEFLVYFIVMGKPAMQYRFYWVTLVELLIIPLFRAGGNNDFCMRASIPALMLLMIIVLQYYLGESGQNDEKKRKRIIAGLLIVGYMVSITEMQRNIALTIENSYEVNIREDVYSFGDMHTPYDWQVEINVDQYMPINYQDSFFYKYIAESGYHE